MKKALYRGEWWYLLVDNPRHSCAIISKYRDIEEAITKCITVSNKEIRVFDFNKYLKEANKLLKPAK